MGILWACSTIVMSMDSSADWIYLTPEQLAEQSDVILVGELIGRDRVRLSDDGPVLNVGVIRVEEVVKGGTQRSVVLLMLAPSRPDGLVASTDVFFQDGQRGLWYLRARGEGLYVADRPDRFVPMDAAGSRIRTLKDLR